MIESLQAGGRREREKEGGDPPTSKVIKLINGEAPSLAVRAGRGCHGEGGRVKKTWSGVSSLPGSEISLAFLDRPFPSLFALLFCAWREQTPFLLRRYHN